MDQRTRNSNSRIMYIEQKSGYDGDGPARIGRVTFSKSGRSVYYQGLRFERIKGGGTSGNYQEIESGDEYWISGIKRDGSDRHWAGSGHVEIDEDVQNEYQHLRKRS